MAERTETLTALLQRLGLQQADGTSPTDVTQAQIELLLTRVAALTEQLRRGPSREDLQATTRLLLADLAMVASQFRGKTNVLGERLTHALESAHLALESSADASIPAD